MSVWSYASKVPTDIVYKLTEQFNNDSHPSKVILCAGAYRDAKGKPFVLPCVDKAEEQISCQHDHEYTGLLGPSDYRENVLWLVFGKDGDSVNYENVAFAQTVSGTGALRVAAELIGKLYLSDRIYLSNPTWRNHHNIFRKVDLFNDCARVENYRYVKDGKLDLDGMLEDIDCAPDRSLFVFHACAHNPTGIDPTQEQWIEIEKGLRKKDHMILFDMAYQGFSSGDMNKDAFAVRYFAKQGHKLMVAQTFSKNMGLYGERIGSLSIVTHDKTERESVESNIKVIVRSMYSTPPLFGRRIVNKIIDNNQLFSEWECTLKSMVDRIDKMRVVLKKRLNDLGSVLNLDQITSQKGMFFLSGLTPEQTQKLIDDYHIYIIPSGRISVVGLTEYNIDYVANAIHDVTK